MASESIVWALVVALALASATTDARSGRIPNWLTLPPLFLAPVAYLGLASVQAALASVVGIIVVGLVPFMMYSMSRGAAIGGGDLKLLMAIGALGGPGFGVEVELGAFCALVLFALVRLTYRGRLWRVLKNVLCLLVNPLLPKARRREVTAEALTEMRMGPAIALAAIAVVLSRNLSTWAPWLV